MSSSRSFDQVKNILGRLDRNIDAARQKRLQGPLPTPAQAPVAPAPTPAPAPAPQRPTFVPAPPSHNPLPTFGQNQPARSIYGRAQPMRAERKTGT